MINLIQRLKLVFMSWLHGEHSFEYQWRIGKLGMSFQAILTVIIIIFAKLANERQIEIRSLIVHSSTFAIQTQSIHDTLQQVNYQQLLVLQTYQNKGSSVLSVQSNEYKALANSLKILKSNIEYFKNSTNQTLNKVESHTDTMVSNDDILNVSMTLNRKLEYFIKANNEYVVKLGQTTTNNFNAHQVLYQKIKNIGVEIDQITLDLSKRINRQASTLNSTAESGANLLYLCIIIFSVGSLCWNAALLYLLSRNIRSNSVLIRRITRLANADPLTGLLNRRALNMAFKTLTLAAGVPKTHNIANGRYDDNRIQTAKFSACLMLIDLDHFKRFNDTFGHVKGDEHLKKCASIWKKNVRSKDFVARMGGEEFAILMPNCDELHADVTAKRLQQSMPEGTSFSAGIALSLPGESFINWYKRADKALYLAKQQGRCRAVLYSQIAKNDLLEAVSGDAKDTSLLGGNMETNLDTTLSATLNAHLTDLLDAKSTMFVLK
jgi:diguanylate cyclase (GGDEF)-like protein